MKIKSIIKKIFGIFNFSKSQEKNDYEEIKIITEKAIVVKDILDGFEKPKSYINREYTTEQLQINAKLKELEKRKLNFCFIPQKMNSINVRSMLEFIYRELPKKAPFDYKGKLRFFLWSKTRKILEKKYRKDIILKNKDDTPLLDSNGKKQYQECFVCEICEQSGTFHQGFKHNTECHEVWKFEDKYRTSVLKRLMVLCPMCHKTAHLNMHENNEELFNELKVRYCFINDLFIKGENGLEPDEQKFIEDYAFALAERERRKSKMYNLDISLWYRLFHKSIEDDYKKDYFEMKNNNVRFRTDNKEYIEFVENEFKED